jgi:predicted PurR-regulated permease PerM
VLLIYLTLILSRVAFGFVVTTQFFREIEDLIRSAPQYEILLLGALHDLQERFPFLPPLDAQLTARLRDLSSEFGALVSQVFLLARFALGVFSGLLSVVFVLLITLYLLVDGARIREYMLSFMATEKRGRIRAVTSRMGERMGRWLIGQIALSLTVGACSFIGLSVLGVKGALVLAIIAGIGEAIPIVGPIAASVPAIAVAATQSVGLAIATLVLYVVIQQLENNLLVPKIMERAVSIHPVAVVLALIIGGELLGITGAIVAVPVAAAAAVVLAEFRHQSEDPVEASAGPAAGVPVEAAASTGT